MTFYRVTYLANNKAVTVNVYGDYPDVVRKVQRVRDKGYRCLIDVTPRQASAV